MKTIKEEYSELLLLTKELILENQEENAHQKWVVSDSETYNYFKTYALQKKNQPENKKVAPYQAPKIENHQPIQQPIYIKPQQVNQLQPPESTPLKASEERDTAPQTTPSEPKIQQFFELSPLGEIAPHDLSDIRKIVQQIAPRQIILDQIPVQNPQILIISDEKNAKEEAFLVNFSKALDICLASSKMISSKKFKETDHFPHLKMIIQVGEKTMQPVENIRFLQIPDLSLFFKEPKEKSKLWENAKHVFLS